VAPVRTTGRATGLALLFAGLALLVGETADRARDERQMLAGPRSALPLESGSGRIGPHVGHLLDALAGTDSSDDLADVVGLAPGRNPSRTLGYRPWGTGRGAPVVHHPPAPVETTVGFGFVMLVCGLAKLLPR
jgi:hypothetical protein